MSPSVEPFNEAKYKALMDGLDCSEIFISEIEENLFRIEAEYFQKKYQIAEKVLNKYDALQKYKKKIECGPFGSNLLDSEYKDSGVLVVRPFNLVDCSIESQRLVYVSNETIKRNNLKKYPKGALLFSRVGDIKVGYANKDNYTISPNIIITDFGDEKLSKYAAVFFNTYYGKIQIERQLKVAAQPTISTEIISKLKLPIFDGLLKQVVDVVDVAADCLTKSQRLYLEAERILQKYIDLEECDTNSWSVKNLSESLLNSGRLDAEYYQSRYDNIVKVLNTNDTVNSLCDIHDANFIPNDCTDYQYIELANVCTNGAVSNVETLKGKDLPTRARRIVKKDQVLISSIEGSLQSCAYITDEYDDALCSTGFYVLTSKRINPETLLVLFKSQPIQALMKQRCSGTILTAITKDELLSMPFPEIAAPIQEEVAKKVQKSFALRRKSEKLTEYAKCAVEIAIEQNEETAETWLKEKVADLGV